MCPESGNEKCQQSRRVSPKKPHKSAVFEPRRWTFARDESVVTKQRALETIEEVAEFVTRASRHRMPSRRRKLDYNRAHWRDRAESRGRG
jgi:hypothetical protein